MRSFVAAAVLSLGALAFVGVSSSQAQYPYGPGYGYPGYYNPPVTGYYGNGGHDYVPHWHQTTTPLGTFNWYGNGLHDVLPHQHIQTPYSYQGFSARPFRFTQSFYQPYPYTYSPW